MSTATTITPRHIRPLLSDEDRVMLRLHEMDDATSGLLASCVKDVEDPAGFLVGYDATPPADKDEARERLHRFTRPQLVELARRVRAGLLSPEAAILQACMHSHATAQLASLPGMARGSLRDVWATKSYRQQDARAGRPIDPARPFVDADWAQRWLDENGKQCPYCEEEMLVTQFRVFDHRQMTAQRVDNALPHYQNNCVAACLRCNLNRREDPKPRPPKRQREDEEDGMKPMSNAALTKKCATLEARLDRVVQQMEKMAAVGCAKRDTGGVCVPTDTQFVNRCTKCHRVNVPNAKGLHVGCGGAVSLLCTVCGIHKRYHTGVCTRILEWSQIPKPERPDVAKSVLQSIKDSLSIDPDWVSSGLPPHHEIRRALQKVVTDPANKFDGATWWKEMSVIAAVGETVVELNRAKATAPLTTEQILKGSTPVPASEYEHLPLAVDEFQSDEMEMAPPQSISTGVGESDASVALL